MSKRSKVYSGFAVAISACGSPRPGFEPSPYVPPPTADDDDAGQGDDDDVGTTPPSGEEPSSTDTAETSDGLANNGQDCSDGAECSSGICASILTGSVCSECADETDCPIDGQSCVYDSIAGYRRCSLGELGDSCQGDAGCSEGVCRVPPKQASGLCSECRDGQQCRDAGTGLSCTMDVTAGYYRCNDGSLGHECYDPADCQSALCRPEGEEAGYGKCSECITDEQCQSSSQGVNCTNKIPEDLDDPTYFFCSTGELGEMCESDLGCSDHRCTEEHCSECKDAKQCRDENKGRNCMYRSIMRHTGWHICTEGNAGEPCTEDESCLPELACAPQFDTITCAECATNTDCSDGMVCGVNYPGDNRACVTPKTLPKDRYCDPSLANHAECEGYCIEIAAGTDPEDPWPVAGVGVCGDCQSETDDCSPGETCVAPEYTKGVGVTGVLLLCRALATTRRATA